MTDAEIEAAARELCRMRGQDPIQVTGSRVTEFGPVPWGPTYLSAAMIEVKTFAEVGTAIASVVGKAKTRKRKE